MEKITTLNDIRRNHSRQVICTGYYRQHDVRKGRDRHGPEEYYGHVFIELQDGTTVMLYPIWHESCIRSNDEILAFEGKLVDVTGTIFLEAPNISTEFPAQNLMLPCLTEIVEIRLAN
ncbi:MAG: hypothetical protein ACOYXT_15365 [Bacteroidota bacterium]